MLSGKESTRISKFLSLVLRHAPERIGITLDTNGWTSVDNLLERLSQHGHRLTFNDLAYIVETNAKQRFAFNEDRSRIRASQGHSVTIDLGYSPVTPPDVLYHGTTEKAVGSILTTGLDKRNRHHVHLSTDLQTARNVGSRHGRPVVLSIDAHSMYRAGYTFYLSDNGVYLTDHVPTQYLSQVALS